MPAQPLRFADLTLGEPVDLAIDEDGVPRNPVILIDADRSGDALATGVSARPARLPIYVILTRAAPVPAQVAAAADLVIAASSELCAGAVVVDDPMLEARKIVERIAASPRAAITLAWLLRAGEQSTVPAALAGESAAYSMLLGSSDFQRWLVTRGARRPADSAERVRLARDGDLLRITLARVPRRNAVDTQMRHALLEALGIAKADDRVRVEIDADGPSFSAGGDLDEFGSARDPATAHLIRVSASVGQALHDLRERVSVRVHGACIGAGIELPAFAGHIIAAPDAKFGLPEVAMGLIPGAGGTVSIPARIGRGRTFWFAVSGEHLDAPTAVDWGLVDELG
jgi:enoyl-CoA hydratase/carnithine racemase